MIAASHKGYQPLNATRANAPQRGCGCASQVYRQQGRGQERGAPAPLCRPLRRRRDFSPGAAGAGVVLPAARTAGPRPARRGSGGCQGGRSRKHDSTGRWGGAGGGGRSSALGTRHSVRVAAQRRSRAAPPAPQQQQQQEEPEPPPTERREPLLRAADERRAASPLPPLRG